MLTSQAFSNVKPKFQIANDLGQKKPIYYIKFGLVTGPLGTSSQILPTQYCTGPIKNQTVARKRYMSAPNTAPQQINRVTFVFSLSALTFNLQDINAEITSMISSYVIKNRLVTIYKGYEDIDEADYITVYVGQVNNVARSQDGTFYTFTVTDVQKQIDTEILKGHAQLVRDFYPGDQAMYLTNSYYFANSTDMQDGLGPRNYVKINDCIFSYTGNASGILIDNLVTWTNIGSGVITASTPQWIAGKGYVTDNTVTWMFLGPLSNTLTAPAWLQNHGYSVGTHVLANNNVYTCAITGTSSAVGTGPSTVGYNITNKVYNLGFIYECVVAGTSSSAASTLLDGTCRWKWVSVGMPTSGIAQWAVTTVYAVGNQVFNLGNIYICTQAGTSGAAGSLGPTGVAIGPNGGGSQASALFGVSQVVLNGNGASSQQTHQAGANVDNYILFQGNPVDIMLQIIMSTGTGTNYSGSGTNYDVFPSSQGIGVSPSMVNVTNFQNQKNRFISWMYFSNYFSDQVTALKFFQEHIFRQAQLYIFTNKSGQLDLSMAYYPLPQVNPITIDNSNVKGIPVFNSNLQTGNDFYNEVFASWDYQPMSDLFTNNEMFTQLASQQAYLERSVLSVDCKFVFSVNGGQKIINRMINIMMQRTKNPLPIIQCDCFAQLQPINVGDKVLLNHPQVPNLLTGKLGGSYICEVVGSSPDYVNDIVHLTLYAIGLSSNKRYAVIGPAGLPTYPSATTANKNYVYIGAVVPGNPQAGQQANGDDGYYISG